MPITEVFQRPTVKQVIFQITYPNLFYLESKIGDLQLSIMEKFPESSLLFRRQVVFADIAPGGKIEDVIEKSQTEQSTKKIWQFNSPKGYQLNIASDSLTMTSQLHKTYANKASDNRFRDIIEFVVTQFLNITKIPLILRIGLRYVDECPMPSNKTADFLNFYKTTFPVERFKIEDATEMNFRTIVKRDNVYVRYAESFKQSPDNTYKLILDFDGFSNNIQAEQWLATTDKLHDIISAEFEATIKDPVYRYMRGENV